jgi:ornithine carbamoyltransferase
MSEESNKPLNEISFCFSGDAHNNVGNSLMIGAALMGMDFRAAAPTALQPEDNLVQKCQEMASKTGASILLTDNPDQAVNGVDFIYTDVWVSMGEPFDTWKERIDFLMPYQVNNELMTKTGNPEVKFMHCLPAFHDRRTEIGEVLYQQYGLEGLEVTDDVFESDASVVFDQSENRLHTIKSIMIATLCEHV